MKKILVILAVVTVVTVSIVELVIHFNPGIQAVAAPVVTALAVDASLPSDLDLTGTLIPVNEANLSAKSPGRIVALSADVGRFVDAGEVLATLDAGMEKATNAALMGNLNQAEASFLAVQELYYERLKSAEQGLVTAKISGQKNIDLATTQLNEVEINGRNSTNSVGDQTVMLVETQLTAAKNDLQNSAKSAVTNAAMYSQSVADSLDQMLGVSKKDQGSYDSTLRNLGALNTGTKTAAENAVRAHLAADASFRRDFNASIVNHDPTSEELARDLLLAEDALTTAKSALEKTSTMLMASVTSDVFTGAALENQKSMVMTLGGNVETALLNIKNLRGSNGVASGVAILGQQLVQTKKQVNASVTGVESQISVLIKQVEKTKADVAANVEAQELGLATLKKERDVKIAEAIANITNLRGQLGITADSLENAFVRAPFSGVITKKFVDVGEVINPTQPIFHLEEEGRFKVIVGIPDTLLSALTIGRETNLSIDGTTGTFPGTITKIAPSADPVTKKINIEIELTDTSTKLKSGLFVRVAFELADVKGVIIPIDALVSRYNQNFVYVTQNNLAIERSVVVGSRTEKFLAITSGIKAGDVIITKGQRYLREGDAVKVEDVKSHASKK